MRFLLLERVEDIPEEFYKEWRTADKNRREVIVREVLQKMGDTSEERKALLALVDPFRTSCYKYGIDLTDNPFIKYFQQFVKKIKPDKKHASYLNTLIMMSENDDSLRERIKSTGRGEDTYLIDPSLFYRNSEDFVYTIKIFENVLDPSKLSKYFKDMSEISIEQLYDNGKIKPAGNESTADDIKTIYGQVEAWAGQNGENDANDDVDLSLDKNKKDDKQPDGKIPRLGKRELLRIKEDQSYGRRFSSLEDADKAGIKDGEVVYVDFKGDMVKNQGDPNNWIDTWMVKKDNKWQKYEVK